MQEQGINYEAKYQNIEMPDAATVNFQFMEDLEGIENSSMSAAEKNLALEKWAKSVHFSEIVMLTHEFSKKSE